MYKSPSQHNQASLFRDLEVMLNIEHPLFKLTNLIDWNIFEEVFSPLYCKNNGRMAKPIRLIVGLLILKHLRNVSDEYVVGQFVENAYYKYFCGWDPFSPYAPCVPEELVYFRKRIGESVMELILKESIRVNRLLDNEKKEEDNNNKKDGCGCKSDKEHTAFIDSTVQEKNITFPTDSKLLNKVVEFCRKVAEPEGTSVRQSYSREIKKLKLIQRFRGRNSMNKKVKKADHRMRTIAGRLVWKQLRQITLGNPFYEKLQLSNKFVNEEEYGGHKIYSLHKPDVLCLAKGKNPVKYVFGNKASIVRLWNGLIIGALSFRNEYDGHTIAMSMEQTRRLYDRPIKILAGDRGYRGLKQNGETDVVIPDNPKKTDSDYMKAKKHEIFRKRAGMEPTIGHCKPDHRLSNKFYKGLFGDSINVMLATAAFNFKRAIGALLSLFRMVLKTVRMLPICSFEIHQASITTCCAKWDSLGTTS